MDYSTLTLKSSFSNSFNNYYYTTNNWASSALLSSVSGSLVTDIPQFEINFNTSTTTPTFINNIANINSLSYPSVGYYLGYRSVNNNFVLSPSISSVNLVLNSTKNYNTSGEDYIFLRLNDWGSFDFFNQIIFSKIYLRSDLVLLPTNNNINKTNNYINKEYVFRQLTNVSKLNIQLIDYLGNIIDLNGIDYSFTISLRVQANIGQKQIFELQNNGY